MKIRERIAKALKGAEYGVDSLDKLIATAYYTGAEEEAKRICDVHNARGLDALARADACRYRKFARRIIGNAGTEIYSPHYAQDMGGAFGDDETAL